MVKVILEFNLDDENSNDAFKHNLAIKAENMYRALYDIGQALRSHEKYGSEPLTREKFWEIISDYNLGEFFG